MTAIKTTLSVIKADIGSIGGHIRPSRRLFEAVSAAVAEQGADLLLDDYTSSTGDDKIGRASCRERVFRAV